MPVAAAVVVILVLVLLVALMAHPSNSGTTGSRRPSTRTLRRPSGATPISLCIGSWPPLSMAPTEAEKEAGRKEGEGQKEEEEREEEEEEEEWWWCKPNRRSQ